MISVDTNVKDSASSSAPPKGSEQTNQPNKPWFSTYYPLFLITAYLILVSFVSNVHKAGIGIGMGMSMDWNGWMHTFMAGFFLVFSAFKFLDLPGFAETYATYDLLAKRWRTYGYIYPFLELGLGLLYLAHIWPVVTYLLTVLIMGFS